MCVKIGDGVFMQQIKNKKYKNICLNGLFALLCTFFFMEMVLKIGYVSESIYQTYKDYYFAYAVIYFLLAVALLQRINLKNWIIYPFAVIYVCLAMAWLKINEMNWGIDIQNIYRLRWVCGGIISILLIDMIRYKKIASFKERSLVGSIFFLLVAIICIVLTKGAFYTYVLFVPIGVLYLLRVKKHDWKCWTISFSVGYYLAFLYVMYQSFMQVPYNGTRYYGIYINHGLFGIFIGGAFICALWWILETRKYKLLLWQRILIYIPIVLPIICCIMNGARVAELAVLIVSLITICIFRGKQNKKQIVYRFVSVGIFFIIIAVLLIVLLYFIRDIERDELKQFVQNEVIQEKIMYWCDRANTFFMEESKYGILEEGTLINALDRFSSGRLSYWVVYLRDLKVWGHGNVYIEIGELVFPHPHNTFVYWLYGMGIVLGTAMIVWLGRYIWYSFKRVIQGESIYILSFLWSIYYTVCSLNEDILWIYIAGFVLLILQYPLLMSWSDEDKGTEK